MDITERMTLMTGLVLLLTVVEAVPISKEGSGESEQPRQEDDPVTDELIKYPVGYSEDKSYSYGNFSYFESSIEEKSISEYDGFINDGNYEVSVNDIITTSATSSTSKDDGKAKDREKEKEPSEKKGEEPKLVTERRPENKINPDGLYLSKIGLGAMIGGLITIILLVGVASASVIKVIRN